jgi:hypothetical protein
MIPCVVAANWVVPYQLSIVNAIGLISRTIAIIGALSFLGAAAGAGSMAVAVAVCVSTALFLLLLANRKSADVRVTSVFLADDVFEAGAPGARLTGKRNTYFPGFLNFRAN